MCGKSDSVGPGLWGLAVPLHPGAWGQRWPTAGTLRALGKPGQELSVGPADPMGAVASLRGGGEAGKGQEVSTQGGPNWPRRGDVGSALENTRGYVYGVALRSSGDLGSAARLQAQPQCTSVSSAPEGASPLPAVSTGNRNSAQLGYEACRQRKACLFENGLGETEDPRGNLPRSSGC